MLTAQTNKYGDILFCTADPTKNAGNLRDYFIQNSDRFVAFHFFPGYSQRNTYVDVFEYGVKKIHKEFAVYRGRNKVLKNGFDYVYFCFVLLFLTRRKSYIIVNAPFFCTFYFIYEFLKSFKYVLWIGDYYPQKNFPMNIYHAVVNFYDKHFQHVVYLSPPLKKVYKFNNSGKNRDVIQLGIKKNILIRKNNSGKKIVMGFIGIIRKQQGLELAMEYISKAKGVVLEVVGDGYELANYKKMAKKMGIEKKVTFYGQVEDIAPIFVKWDIGIALYEDKSDNLSLYCEPTKIKHYLSYGLPVITTKATYFYEELEQSKAGIAIHEDAAELGSAVTRIMKSYAVFQTGVKRLVEKYEYSEWYDKKLKFLRKVT